jgi:hypothetical protein
MVQVLEAAAVSRRPTVPRPREDYWVTLTPWRVQYAFVAFPPPKLDPMTADTPVPRGTKKGPSWPKT